MTFLQSLIFGNIIVITFNLSGMASGMKPPPVWAYVVGWPGVIAAIYFLSQAA